jgi:hypothetical protein
MRSGDTRIPLIVAGVSAGIAYLVIGSSSPFDLLHYLHRDAHKHDSAVVQTADFVPAVRAAEEAARAEEARAEAKEEKARADEARAEAGLAKSPTQVRVVEDFSAIELDSESATTIRIGDKPSVVVTEAPDGPERVLTHVRDGRLVVTGGHASVEITVPHLHKLQVNRAGSITLAGLRDPLAITINGVASLTASGAVDQLDLVLNGASKLEFAALEAKNVSIRMNGVSEANVFATETLSAEMHGPGRVRYLGEPHVTSNATWPGTVAPISRAS